MRNGVAALTVIVALAGAPGRRAEAAGFDAQSLEGVGLTVLYVVPVAGGLFTSTINGTYLAYDEGSPRRWHVLGYVAGGVDLAVGVGILTLGDGSDSAVILGVLPIVVGVASLATAYFVDYPDDIVGGNAALVPLVGPDLAGVGVVGRF